MQKIVEFTLESRGQINSLKPQLLVQASRLLANLIVMGGGIMARAVVQAYRQALMSMPFVGSSFCQ